MHSSPQKTQRRAIDKQLQQARTISRFLNPGEGWAQTIRKAIGLTATQLAARLHSDPSNIIRMEQREASGKITLETLDRLANALGCDLVYNFVPRKPLEEMVHDRAVEVAQRELDRVSHSMALEGQATDSHSRRELLSDLVDELVRETPTRLWDDEG